MPNRRRSTHATAQSKQHLCLRCDKRFARLEHLQRHERSHTKEKPFQCERCSHAFTRKDLLVRHRRLSHEASVDETVRGSRIGPSHSTPLTASPTFISNSGPSANSAAPTAYPPTSTLPKTIFPQDGLGRGGHDNILNELTTNLEPTVSYDADFFASFLDTINFPSHPFSPLYNPLPSFSSESLFDGMTGASLPVQEENNSGLSRFGSRLPSLQPEDQQQRSNPQAETRPRALFKVSESCRDRIVQLLVPFSNVIVDQYTLPSRHTLERFIAGYMTVFHQHYPFLHASTLSTESISVELFLAIAALGAQYCRESDKGAGLFRICKAVALERVRMWGAKADYYGFSHWDGSGMTKSTHFFGRNAEGDAVHFQTTESPRENRITPFGPEMVETAQTLLLLIALATWSEHSASEALSIRSTLERLVRQKEFGPIEENPNDPWGSWVSRESIKRTKFMVFCFFNLHTIVFDTPPMVLFADVKMDLPCTNAEWNADSFASWSEARRNYKPEPRFQDALKQLFRGSDVDSSNSPEFSSLGGYVLIHALIQHIWILQQAARLPSQTYPNIPAHEVGSIERALKRWRYGWERDHEASISPVSPHGPLSFNSTALLRLAYIRINIDTGSIRSLSTWDPRQIAESLSRSDPICRSDKMTRAALHCAHALSIPVKIGINFVAHTQVFYWSNQHALCSLECALLLSKWLEAVTVQHPDPPLSGEEKRLLDFVVEMVHETAYDAPLDQLLQSKNRLSIIVCRVWAKLFRSDSIWQLVHLIGSSLNAYADLLEAQAG